MAKVYFLWNDDYSVGIDEIDDQHKKIFSMLNNLYDAFMLNKHHEMINDIINEMVDYSIYHFKTEEKYFEKFQYTDRVDHIFEHKQFIEAANNFKKKSNSTITFKVINFLTDWLKNHVMVSDKGYVKCFKDNGL